MNYRFARSTILAGLLVPAIVHAQEQSGRIAGKIFDKATGQPIVEASLVLLDASNFTQTDAQGAYFFDGVPTGTYTVRVYKVGYEPFDVSGVEVTQGRTNSLDIALPRRESTESTQPTTSTTSSSSTEVDSSSPEQIFELAAMEVTAESVRAQNVEVVAIRQQSLGVIDALSSDNMSRFAVSDVAEAITKVTGINVSDGKYAVVRGLNDRYTTTQLNGVVMPSPDPDRQAVQLDIFPSAMIDQLIANKTFTPDLPGESSGGSLNIKTKGIPEERIMGLSVGFGLRDNTSFNDNFITSDVGNDDWLAQGYDDRVFPQSDTNGGVIAPNEEGEPGLNYSGSISYGDRFKIFGDQEVGFIGALSWKRDYYYREIMRAERRGDFRLGEGVVALTSLENPGDTTEQPWGIWNNGIEEVTLSGLASLSYRPLKNQEFRYTFFFTRNGTEDAEILPPMDWDDDGDSLFYFSSLGYSERELQLHQFEGHHFLPELMNSNLDWSYSYSTSLQDEVIRNLKFFRYNESTQTYSVDRSGDRKIVQFSRETDQENQIGKLDYTLPLEFIPLDTAPRLKVGGQYENVDREFIQLQSSSVRPFSNLESPLDAFGTSVYVQNAGGEWIENGVAEGPATGNREIKAGYLMAEVPFNFLSMYHKFVAGARYEDAAIEFDGVGTISGINFFPSYGELRPIDEDTWLPAVALNTDVTDSFKIRLAYSRTVARPSFRELAPFPTYSLADNSIEFGNPGEVTLITGDDPVVDGLEQSRVDNYDVRFEYYFGDADLVSVNFFYKQVANPIERYEVLPDRFTFENNENSGTLKGVEFEVNKNLGFMGDFWSVFNLGGNATYVDAKVERSELELGPYGWDQNGASLLPRERQFYDQPEYILNGYFNFRQEDWGTDVTLSANWVSARLSSVGYLPQSTLSIYDEEVTTLNLVISQKLTDNLSIKFSAKNLLDPWINQVYDPELVDLGASNPDNEPDSDIYRGLENPYARSSYKKGRSFSISISYDFF
ncbi:MAG: outer membrane receptor protein [Puniceicoccaceae bacterium 5H]|nr:MAG: outer membrane receptor protein [Puniceicoccaceae bacterium 5H]